MSVTNSAFELVFAFDEVVSLGNKEKLNISQVKQLLAMDSQEERMAEAVQRNKEREAAADAERRRKELEAMRAEESRRGGGTMFARGATMASMSSSSYGGGNMSNLGGNVGPQIEKRAVQASSASAAPARKGLSLTSTAPKANDYMDTLKQEMGASSSEMTEMLRQQQQQQSSSSPLHASAGMNASPHVPPASMRDDVHVAITEKLLVRLDKDGNVQHFEVRGELDVFVAKEQYQQVVVRLNPKCVQQGLDWKVHPNFNKQRFLEHASLQLRDPSKSLALNAANGVLKWRLLSQDSTRLPLLVNCWPSAGANPTHSVINMEYEARKGLELHDVLVKIPIVAKGHPNVTSCNGETHFDSKNSVLEWAIPLIDSSNLNGNLDFELETWKNNDTAHLFPIHVKFTSQHSLCDIGALQVLLGDQPVKFSQHAVVSVESYSIE